MLIYITLHIFSVCLFIGNSIISAFWKIMADRTKDIVVIQYATKLINLTDLLFTGTGTVLIAISGQIISENYGGVLSNPWILTSYILLGCSALIWLMVLIPIQLKQSKTIKHITSNEPVPDQYYKLSLKWIIMRIITAVVTFPAIYLMINK